MKKVILGSVVSLSILLGTNGDLMLSDGTKSSGMGGVGMAVAHGPDSLYANPAMMKEIKESEFASYITYFTPKVEFASDAFNDAQGKPTPVPAFAKSKADQSFIPGFAYARRYNEQIVWGVSVAGTAGMGTDYKKASPAAGVAQMQTTLEIAKLSIPVAYTMGDFTAAIAPVLQYSTLQMNYGTPAGLSQNDKATNTAMGVTVGLAYDMGDLTFGAMYKSKIKATYKDNIAVALKDFGMHQAITSGDTLDQPSEIAVGVAYKMGSSTFATDFKQIAWADATGYKDFGWENQNVFALGYQYEASSWAFRAGFNHGKSPIKELDASPKQDGSTYPNAGINFFNLAGFPAVVENHFTIGGDYDISDKLGLSMSLVYSPEVTVAYNTTALSAGAAFNGAKQAGATDANAGAAGQAASTGSTANVKHSQTAITVGLQYKF